ncbi:aspartyl/asparaginyl beta-hydroxylase domain-containing protein [Euzebya pacifica]|jgi:beta-hydroxylase|uniref:aspartyl/asparaginyl beta-hydroxylase domain-containing protein n=1 Tax=Euzebya pacifica TaxID=1608957 RepID=UPI0030F4F4BE
MIALLRRLIALIQQVAQANRLVPDLVHRLYGRFSLVGTEPFLDRDQFDWTHLLESHYPAIREEAEQVLRVRDALPNFQDIAPDDILLSDDDRWKTYWFVGYDLWDDANCIRSPRTAAVLRAIPGMTTAFFSILAPGKDLPPHVGPYRGVLRHHLALIVPEPAEQAGIEVGGEVRHWEEGRSLTFDDTYVHRAWNDTDGVRVVLFCDIVRPLRWPLSWLNRLIITSVARSPFIKRARAQHVAREQAFAAQWAEHAEVGRP